MFQQALYELAATAVDKLGLRGIDWSALTQKGRSSVWDRDYMNDYIAPAQLRMMATVGSLELVAGGDPVEYQKSYQLNTSLLTSIAEGLGNITGVNIQSVKATVQLSRESTRYLVSHVYQAAMYGALLHFDESIHHSGASDAEIATHAGTVVGMMNAITMLDMLGFYRVLDMKRKPGTAGLGLAPALVIAGVVVAVAALALLAWMIISLSTVSKTNALVATMCTQAQASGDSATTQQCVKTLTDQNKQIGTLVPDTLKAVLTAILPYALAGMAAYALVLFAPAILKSLIKSKSSA